MAITVTVGGIDRTTYCDLRSINIVDTIVNNADSLDMDISLPLNSTWRPTAGNPVVIANGTGKEFGGVILDIDEELRGSSLRYRCAGKDYTWFFDKYLVVDESTGDLSADTWVSRIVNGFTTGFTGTGITTGPLISGQRFDYIPPSEAIRSIADKVGYGWYIDYDQDVHFFAANTQNAPTTQVDADASTAYGNFRFHESALAVKNRIYVKDYKHASSAQWNRSFTGDGNTRFFLLGNEPASIDATQMSITVDGVAVDPLVDFVDGSPGQSVGTTSQGFICFDNQGLRTSTGVSALSSSQTLSVTFNVLEDAFIQVQSTAAQDVMAAIEGGDGIHEYAISDASLTAPDGDDDLATLAGTLALARYAYPRLNGSFETFSSGWRAGQVFDITTTKRMGGFTDTFHVQQVTKTIVNASSSTDPTFKTTVEFADGILAL